MSDKPTYSIRNWDTNFENHETRKLKTLKWVLIPNKHDGKGYKRISRDPQAVSVFCAWNLIVEIASKMPERGVLADEDGPLDATDLADMTEFPAEIFDAAFALLTRADIAWLECESNGVLLPASPVVPGASPGVSRRLPDEGKRREGKGRELKGASFASIPPPFASTPFLKTLTAWELHRVELRKPWTDVARERNYVHFQKWGEVRSIAAMEFSMRMGYSGIYEDTSRNAAAPVTQSKMFEEIPGPANCPRCRGTNTEVVPGKGARPCDHRTEGNDDL